MSYPTVLSPRDAIQSFVVTADQMTAIETRVFAAGMPVAALMEKVAGLIFRWVVTHYSQANTARVGILVGPGHNGGDALVVARELHLTGYRVQIYHPFSKAKDLTQSHAAYAQCLGIPFVSSLDDLKTCDVLIDGLFGFGLTRSLEGEIAQVITQLNQWHIPIVSIDLPSGLHTDTGEVLGVALRATHTLCLGLWKLALLQDCALDYVGAATLIDFGLPIADIQAVVGEHPKIQRITSKLAIAPLLLPRSPTTHKYRQGHVLLICGSRQYMGAALLAGLGARASGVGMVSIAVPESLKPWVVAQLPEAVVIGCPEQPHGAIAALPESLDGTRYDAIGCGPGLTPLTQSVIQQVLTYPVPLVLDADGLNILAALNQVKHLRERPDPTVLTPHLGEFQRLFPHLAQVSDRMTAITLATQYSGAIVVLKGARVAIAAETETGLHIGLNPISTPALARGGSGDVLTGLMAGIVAQPHPHTSLFSLIQSAVGWHAQAGCLAAQSRSERGVDAYTLTQFLIPALLDSPKSCHLGG